MNKSSGNKTHFGRNKIRLGCRRSNHRESLPMGQIVIVLNLWKNLAERVKIYIIWTFIFLKKLAWARQQFFHRQKISLVKTGFPSGKIGASGRLIFLENSRRNLVHQKTWHKQFFWNQQTLVFFTRLGSRSQKRAARPLAV